MVSAKSTKIIIDVRWKLNGSNRGGAQNLRLKINPTYKSRPLELSLPIHYSARYGCWSSVRQWGSKTGTSQWTQLDRLPSSSWAETPFFCMVFTARMSFLQTKELCYYMWFMLQCTHMTIEALNNKLQ